MLERFKLGIDFEAKKVYSVYMSGDALLEQI